MFGHLMKKKVYKIYSFIFRRRRKIKRLRNVEKQVQGFRTRDGAGVSLVRVLGHETKVQ